MESFEYVDRNYDGKIVQIGMFEEINDPEKLKKGDRFICPASEEYPSGIVDSNTMKPVLLFVKEIRDYHIIHSSLENGKGNPGIAFDICYLLRDDI